MALLGQSRELAIYGTARPQAKFKNKNAMALLGQVKDSWWSIGPLGNAELTKTQKLLESKSKNKNENEKTNTKMKMKTKTKTKIKMKKKNKN